MSKRGSLIIILLLAFVIVACKQIEKAPEVQPISTTGTVNLSIQTSEEVQQEMERRAQQQAEQAQKESSILTAAIPVLEVTSPTEGQELSGGKVTIKASVSNFDLVDYTTHKTATAGEGHLHFFIDGGRYAFTYFPSYTYTDVKPGEHEITVILVNSDHTNLKPSIEKKVKFMMS